MSPRQLLRPRKRATQTFHAHADTHSVRVTIYLPRSGPTMTMWPKCDRRPRSVHQDVWLKESMRSWCARRGLWGVDVSSRGQYCQANQTAWGREWVRTDSWFATGVSAFQGLQCLWQQRGQIWGQGSGFRHLAGEQGASEGVVRLWVGSWGVSKRPLTQL